MGQWQPDAIPGRGLRTFEVVIQQIREAINAGELGPGDRLPSERALADALNVSRTSVREAIRVLEALEIVIVRVGSGPNQGVTIRESVGEGLTGLFEMWLSLHHIELSDLVQFREAIEGWACTSKGPDAAASMDRLEVITRRMNETSAMEEYFELDSEFHLEVVRFSGNRLGEIVINAIRLSIQANMLSFFSHHDNWDEIRLDLTNDHRSIYECLRDGDGEKARAITVAHVRNYFDKYAVHDDST